MGTYFEQNYRPDFSEESFVKVQEELTARQELRKQNYLEFNKFVEAVKGAPEDFQSELQKRFPEFVMLCYELDRESWLYGMAQMYDCIYRQLPHDLHRIVLRVFKELKVPLSEKLLTEALEFAVFRILADEKLKGKLQKEIAKEWGKDEVYWSRVKKSAYAKSYQEFIHKFQDFKRKELGELPSGDEEHKEKIDHRKSENTPPEFQSTQDRLSIRSMQEFRSQDQQEKSEDWAIAGKMVLRELDKAMKFLETSGASEKSRQNFRKELAVKISGFQF